MDNQLYIRVRGRVLGPYDQEKLQSLARRGQLSRMHELSADAVNWVRASNYPELFVGHPVAIPAESQPMNVAVEGVTATGATVSHAPSQSQWHYTSAGVQRGPVDFGNLQLLFGTGQLGPDDLVWSDGMPAWIPASQIPGLIKGPSATALGTQDGLPPGVYRSAYSARPWVVFITIAVCVYAGIEALAGMALLILARGGKARLPWPRGFSTSFGRSIGRSAVICSTPTPRAWEAFVIARSRWSWKRRTIRCGLFGFTWQST